MNKKFQSNYLNLEKEKLWLKNKLKNKPIKYKNKEVKMII